MELDATSHSITKLASLDSPARAAAVRCKMIWDDLLPKEIRGACLLNHYRLLAQDIQSLEHQAMSPSTRFGALFEADRQKERRRTKTPETASAFVLNHLVFLMFPETDEAQREARHKRLTKDGDIGRNVNGICGRVCHWHHPADVQGKLAICVTLPS